MGDDALAAADMRALLDHTPASLSAGRTPDRGQARANVTPDPLLFRASEKRGVGKSSALRALESQKLVIVVCVVEGLGRVLRVIYVRACGVCVSAAGARAESGSDPLEQAHAHRAGECYDNARVLPGSIHICCGFLFAAHKRLTRGDLKLICRRQAEPHECTAKIQHIQ